MMSSVVAQRERTLHRNFQGYTTKAGADLFGFGVSSISGLERAYAQNFRVLQDYYAAIEQNHIPTMRGIRLTDDDILRRAVISRILCHCVLHKKEIEQDFHMRFDEYFAEELMHLKTLADDGLVVLEPESIFGHRARANFHPQRGHGIRHLPAQAQRQTGLFEDLIGSCLSWSRGPEMRVLPREPPDAHGATHIDESDRL